jgi:hypothetical protein
MPHRVQFLDTSKKLIAEEQAECWSATKLFELRARPEIG